MVKWLVGLVVCGCMAGGAESFVRPGGGHLLVWLVESGCMAGGTESVVAVQERPSG